MPTPRVVESIADVRRAVHEARGAGRRIGFVPTMGALHEGHARLVETSVAETDFTVVSIFVNPTQFGPNEDYTRYPRTLATDLECCGGAGADLVFTPDLAMMYPRPRESMTFVEVPGLTTDFEGASRPTHFRGVTTVVLKLFAIVEPDVAFFGAKDYQQQLVIRRMVDDLNLPLVIRTVPTVREPDGLAKSSRNRYLSPEDRQAATVLSRALRAACEAVRAGERDPDRVRQILVKTIESDQRVSLDYAELADADTLERVRAWPVSGRVVGLLAARVGTTRLIDNAILTDESGCV